MTSPLPLPLQLLSQLLAQDRAQSLGRAVLFVIDADLAKVEANKAQVAIDAGITLARLDEVLATAHGILSAPAQIIHNQHTVSQVVLRQFVGRDTRGKEGVATYSTKTGPLKQPRSVRTIGRLKDFVKIDGDTTEALWGKTENKMRAAIDAANSKKILKDATHVETLKDAIALHFARSLEVLQAHRLLWEAAIAEMRNYYSNHSDQAQQLYYLKHGFYAGTSQLAAEEMSKELSDTTRKLYEDGTIFRLRVAELFEQAQTASRTMGLQIVRPASGEFLIGDSPTFPFDWEAKKAGILGGVSFLQGKAIFLPIGPKRAVALSKKDEYIVAPRWLVDRLNWLQVMKAQSQIYYRPEAHFKKFLQKSRPPTSPVKKR